jgi:two-component system phosphate regulon sensor histidine kinase PhoR
MDVNPRATAFLLASTISIVTTAFLSLIQDTSAAALFVAASISFSSTFLLSYLTLEFLIFKEIKDIHELLNELKNTEDGLEARDLNEGVINPLKRINLEIKNFASDKQAEIEALQRSNEFRREFLADVSHELKTPIFAAQGFLYTLLDGASDDKKVRMKFLKKAAKSLDGLDRLVQDLLTVSQMESGEITMQKETFDIRSLAFEVIDQLSRKAEKQESTVKVDDEAKQPVFVYADRLRMSQVFTNLLENAIKYGRESQGLVLVSFKPKDDRVEVSVRDNGSGIPQEHLNRVFERFYMVDKSRNKTRTKKGSGLGLAIVKHIIEGHGSEIGVESKIGIGTVFTFELNKSAMGSENGELVEEV